MWYAIYCVIYMKFKTSVVTLQADLDSMIKVFLIKIYGTELLNILPVWYEYADNLRKLLANWIRYDVVDLGGLTIVLSLRIIQSF